MDWTLEDNMSTVWSSVPHSQAAEEAIYPICTNTNGVGGGVQPHRQTFDLVKIREKLLKIRATSVEIWAKCMKTLAKLLYVI